MDATRASVTRQTMARVNTFAFSGIDAVPVEVQVQIASGAPGFLIVGLPDKAVGEARERVRAAFAAMGLSLPPRRVLINLKPADLLKEGSHFDLPLALGVLAAMDVLPRDEISGYAALGELSLDGAITPVAGVLPAAIGAAAQEMGLICPAAQGGEAAWAGSIEVLAATELLALINHFRGTQVLTPPEPPAPAAAATLGPDLVDVKGMETARRAVEIAAAGGHNLLLVRASRPTDCAPPFSGLAVQVAPNGPILDDLAAARSVVLLNCRGCRQSTTLNPELVVMQGAGPTRLCRLGWMCQRCGCRRATATVVGAKWRIGPFEI